MSADCLHNAAYYILQRVANTREGILENFWSHGHFLLLKDDVHSLPMNEFPISKIPYTFSALLFLQERVQISSSRSMKSAEIENYMTREIDIIFSVLLLVAYKRYIHDTFKNSFSATSPLTSVEKVVSETFRCVLNLVLPMWSDDEIRTQNAYCVNR